MTGPRPTQKLFLGSNDNHDRSVVSISSFANGAFGLHRRQEIDGISPEIAPPGCRSSVRRSTQPTFGSSGSGRALASGWLLLTATPRAA
jgi:hypothetical protein